MDTSTTTQVQQTQQTQQTPPGKLRPIRPLMEYDLHLPTWEATAKDKAAAKQVKVDKKITEEGDFVRVLIDLLPNCPELKKLNAARRAMRGEFYLLTAPWRDKRSRRVTQFHNHHDMLQWWAGVCDTDTLNVRAFVDVYASAVQEAQFTLQDAFMPENYPSPQRVAEKFSRGLDWNPVQDIANDIRVLTKDSPEWDAMRAEEIERAEQHMHEAMEVAMTNVTGELLTPIKNMAEQLRRYKEGDAKKLYDTLVENVRDMAQRAKSLNFCGDTTVEQFADSALALVDGITTDDLKDSEGLTSIKMQEAEALVARMNAVFGG